MARALRTLLGLTAIVGVGYAMRRRLVHVLTRTTGTWVGSPDA